MVELRAPAGDGEVLAVPGCDAIPGLVQSNRHQLDHDRVQIGGMPLRAFRAQARREVLEIASGPVPTAGGEDDPLLIAGHQPELSHPGVWVKNFALNALGRKLGGHALHLIADTDTLKSTALRLPVFRDHDPDSVHLASLPFDAFSGAVAYECRPVLDLAEFRTVAERARPIWANWGYEPLLARDWAVAIAAAGRGAGIGEAFTAMRRQRERAWGCSNREITVSRLARTDTFSLFARHILDDLARFRTVYNAAIRRYREAYGIASANHPAPELADGEAPFWVQDAGCRRGRATAASGLRMLRPRALTLTLFARVALGDFFIHGIGGGKYDEVTDTIIRDYLGIDPPAFQVLSATLHLPLPAFPSTRADVRRAGRRVRDLRWNPHRFVGRGTAAGLVDRHAALAASEPPYREHAARRQRFLALRRVKEELQAKVAGELPAAEADRDRATRETRANAILKRRDYSWVFYPEDVLRTFVQGFLS